MKAKDMRDAISHVYAGPIWRLKCQEMTDDQVTKTYNDFLKAGMLDEKPKTKKTKAKEPLCEQLTIFDLLKDDKE